jgi:hypothetical protein
MIRNGLYAFSIVPAFSTLAALSAGIPGNSGYHITLQEKATVVKIKCLVFALSLIILWLSYLPILSPCQVTNGLGLSKSSLKTLDALAYLGKPWR